MHRQRRMQEKIGNREIPKSNRRPRIKAHNNNDNNNDNNNNNNKNEINLNQTHFSDPRKRLK